jgi:tryptophan-rich sensory protein
MSQDNSDRVRFWCRPNPKFIIGQLMDRTIDQATICEDGLLSCLKPNEIMHSDVLRVEKLEIIPTHFSYRIIDRDDSPTVADLTKVDFEPGVYPKTFSRPGVNHGFPIGSNKHKEAKRSMDWKQWYDSLDKPNWTPEPATIGFIWQCLYPVILVTFSYVFWKAIRREIPWQVALPFAINLFANLIFTRIQFGLRNLPLATLDILIVWITILWMIIAIWKHHPWIAFAQVPYFIWVSTATILQILITWNNRS